MNSSHLFELMIAMLPVIIGLHYLAHRLRLSPVVPLLIGGVLVAFLPGLPTFSPDPELMLVIFLPPLLMDGAWSASVQHLRRHMIGIASLAVGAVLFTTIVVAMVAHLLFPPCPGRRARRSGRWFRRRMRFRRVPCCSASSCRAGC